MSEKITPKKRKKLETIIELIDSLEGYYMGRLADYCIAKRNAVIKLNTLFEEPNEPLEEGDEIDLRDMGDQDE